MAGFYMNGEIRLVRNHEDRNDPGAGSIDATGSYDELAGGGTTTLVVDPRSRELLSDFVSLNGTIVNCAGGPTPWNSWITCEETNAGTPQGWEAQHGYCFDVPASANGPVAAVPLTDMGRFAHEAVAVDPATGTVYETEDAGDSGFYRFLPNTPGVLVNGGILQMLAIDGSPQYDTTSGQTVGVPLPVKWVTIPNPNPAGHGSNDVYDQGFGAGAAKFDRLEGCWHGSGSIYFVSTSGGNVGEGQVWEYKIAAGTLTLVFESPSAAVLNGPDNLTVSPNGSLLLCEDGDGDQYVRGVTPGGEIFDFALNLQNGSEWAGATFVQHGPGNGNGNLTLFVNRQGETRGTVADDGGDQGLTFAIWGPWNKGAL